MKLLFKEDIFGMANINKDEYPNLPVNIWVKQNDGKSKHGPRIKVQNNTSANIQPGATISVSISKTPEIKAGKSKLDAKTLSWVYEFITDNYELLIQHYNGQISDRTLLNTIYDILEGENQK